MDEPVLRPLGARSRQTAALAALAIPVLEHLRMRPAQAMRRRAAWGEVHGVNANADFHTRGLRRG